MADVIALRPAALVADDFGHHDVIADGDGVWWQHETCPSRWYGFGSDDETPADRIPQPWTLICRADEVTDLVHARQWAIDLEGRNEELLRLASGACKSLSNLGTVSAEKPVVEAALTAVRALRADLERLDPLRGGE